jgi:hypothetical protein
MYLLSNCIWGKKGTSKYELNNLNIVYIHLGFDYMCPSHARIAYVMARSRLDFGSNRFCLLEDLYFIVLVKLVSTWKYMFWSTLKNWGSRWVYNARIVCVLGQNRPNFGTNRFGLVEVLYFIVLENITSPSNYSFWYWLKDRDQFPKIGLDGSIMLDCFA